jgi:hypothetical protein
MHQLRRPPISPSRYGWIVAINQFELAQRGLERRTHYRSFGFENSDWHHCWENFIRRDPG